MVLLSIRRRYYSSTVLFSQQHPLRLETGQPTKQGRVRTILMSLRTSVIIAHLAQKNILREEDVGEYLWGPGT
jgi:hypothetical protein